MTTKNLIQVGGTSTNNSALLSAATSTGSGFYARTFLAAPRYRELDRKQAYADCTQHDYKRYDFEGRILGTETGVLATQPLLSAEVASQYVSLRQRRPSSPYRLPRVMVHAFTNMIFGEGRFPKFIVQGDDDTQDFQTALAKAMNLPVRMIRARNLGGAVGTVGLSWCFVAGKPRCTVHNAKYLYVHKWEDRDELIPRHVTELYQYPVDEYDRAKQRYVRNIYWYRRDWTPDADVVFNPVLVDPAVDPDAAWRQPETGVDFEKSYEHNEGRIHFEWIQNMPTEGIDGESDYEGLYESFDTIDLLLSVLTRGTTLNLDPTLVLKMDALQLKSAGIKKGSDNALVVGKDGAAEYLELNGTGIKGGIDLFNAKRRAILETAQCVIPDPDEVSIGTSAVARKVRYAPMLAKCDVLRAQYGAAMSRMLDAMTEIARQGMEVQVYYNANGDEQPEQMVIDLPQRVETEPEEDEDGNLTGDDKITRVDRSPGEGGDIELEWGEYFPLTPQDQSAVITMLSTAIGQQPFISAETATELAMAALGKSVGDEKARVAGEKQKADDQKADEFQQQMKAMGGAPGSKGAPPGKGGTPAPPGGSKKPGSGGGGPFGQTTPSSDDKA